MTNQRNRNPFWWVSTKQERELADKILNSLSGLSVLQAKKLLAHLIETVEEITVVHRAKELNENGTN